MNKILALTLSLCLAFMPSSFGATKTPAKDISVDASSYSGNLSSTDTNVQLVANKLNGMYLGGGWTHNTGRINPTTNTDSLILGEGTAVGTSGTKVLAMNVGTSPTTSPANMVQYYAEDVPQDATGGTITTSGGNTIHTFTTSGTFTAPTGGLTVSVLIVAGGGGGAGDYSNIGCGGGAGGFRKFTGVSASAGANSIVVGLGGAGGGDNTKGTSGGNSSALGYESAGGGGGGYYTQTGIAGGSGGGGSGNAAGNTPSTSPSQGNQGGQYYATTTGSGGGGASQAGADGALNTPGVGGDGTADSISGSSVTYAGGGGGGLHTNIAGTYGANGGAGGGGRGGRGTNAATNGTDGLGGGGGGGASGTGASTPGGDGGDGIVIISYPTVGSLAEARVRDEAGNVTTLSPHNFQDMPESVVNKNKLSSDNMAWTYHSEKDGKSITVDMFKLSQLVEKMTGETLIYSRNAAIENKEKTFKERIDETPKGN